MVGQKRRKLFVAHPDIFGCSKESDIKESDIKLLRLIRHRQPLASWLQVKISKPWDCTTAYLIATGKLRLWALVSWFLRLIRHRQALASWLQVNINKPWDCMSYLIANKKAEIMGTGVLLLTINQTCTFFVITTAWCTASWYKSKTAYWKSLCSLNLTDGL